MNSRSSNNGHLDVPEDDAPPPPYTETDIYSNSGAGGSRSPHTMTSSQTLADDGASSTGDVIYTPPLSPHITPSPHQPGAALYFESRPPPVPQQNSATRAAIAHNVRVNNTSLPDDLPYQSDWAARDVTPQDWATFVNYLLPDHTTRGNEAILARKLQAEGRSDSSSMSSGVSQVEAQMGQIRDSAPGGSPNPAQRRRDIEATIQQWNDGFFGPRGINVHLEPPRDQQQQIPGAWSTSFDQREPAAPSQGEANRSGQGRVPGPGWRGWGDFHIDENSIRYGNNFVADQNGLRIGNLVMDQHGIRLQGDTSTPGQQSSVGGAGPSVGQPMSAPSSPYGHGFGHAQEREIRGRRIHHFEGGQGKDRRERSHSVSSNSSTSSSGSESSIGSLPDYDDIPQHAMPLYVSRLQDWTSHPEQLRKKEDVKRLKSELKSVAKSRNSQLNADKKALKAQIKSMTAEWKQIKKQQRKTRREGRKARREKRRAEKKERRQTKREMKRAHKEARRNSYPRPLPPGPPPPSWIPPLPPMTAGQSNPQIPPNPPQLPQSPYSSTPPVPPMPYSGGFPFGRGRGGRCCGSSSRGAGFFGSSSGAFGGRHPTFCGGNHGGDHGPFGPHGPFGEHGPFGSNGPFGAGGPFGPGGPFGSRGGGPSNSRSLPGSWPDEKKEAVVSEVQDDEIPPPGPVAAAKYRAMENIQAAIEQQTAAAEKLGPCPQRDGLELAIGKLLQNLDKLRIEADEAYAKDLMREAGGN